MGNKLNLLLYYYMYSSERGPTNPWVGRNAYSTVHLSKPHTGKATDKKKLKNITCNEQGDSEIAQAIVSLF